ncbi:hypothetical protein T439DRAFT_382889 [Meredithblackwellia eburnea MCA 4105]
MALLRTVMTTAGAGVTSALIGMKVAHAQEATESRQLPIYDSEPTVATLVPSPSPLQHLVKQARETGQDYQQLVQSHAQLGLRTWIGWEGQVERGWQVRALVPENEPLTPGVFYVGVATLAGSILTSKGNFVFRLMGPSVFFVGTVTYFFPRTAARFRSEIQGLKGDLRPFKGNLSQMSTMSVGVKDK